MRDPCKTVFLPFLNQFCELNSEIKNVALFCYPGRQIAVENEFRHKKIVTCRDRTHDFWVEKGGVKLSFFPPTPKVEETGS